VWTNTVKSQSEVQIFTIATKTHLVSISPAFYAGRLNRKKDAVIALLKMFVNTDLNTSYL
jgi:hypothetical protein